MSDGGRCRKGRRGRGRGSFGQTFVRRPKKEVACCGPASSPSVAIVAGAAFAEPWHEQPSFCNAVCHNPMDAYVEAITGRRPGRTLAGSGTTCLRVP